MLGHVSSRYSTSRWKREKYCEIWVEEITAHIAPLTRLKTLAAGLLGETSGVTMGTVEKIVETMHRLCNDKKLQVTHRYDHHSAWLQSELKQIRDLLQNTVTEELPRMEASNDATQNDVSKKRKSSEDSVPNARIVHGLVG